MQNDSIAHYGHHVGASEWTPADTGLSAIDLKTVALTPGIILPVSGYGQFAAILEYIFVGTTPTLGTVLMTIEGFSQNGTKIMDSVTILTLTSTQAAGTYRSCVAWGYGTPAVKGTGTITAANFDVLKALKRVRLNLDVTTAYNQTGAKTASVYLIGAP